MKGITDEFKSALLTDVEQICETTLTEEQKTALARCFEITIWHRITPSQRLEAAGLISNEPAVVTRWEQQESYPVEFVEWKDFNCDFDADQNKYLYEYGDNGESKWFTLPDLFLFWQEKIKEK